MATPVFHRGLRFAAASAVAVLGVFGLFALLERLWFPEAEADPRVFFLTRGAVAAAAVVVLALWRHRRSRALQVQEGLLAISRNAIEGIITVDRAGRILQVNPAAGRMFRYPPDELVGRLADVLVPHRLREPWRRLRDGVLSGEPAPFLDTPLDAAGLRKDGTEFPVEISIAHWVVGGEPTFAGIIRDVTERRRADAALRESEQRLRNAHALASLGSWEWNVETGEITWSDELYAICGRDPASWRPTLETIRDRTCEEDLAVAEDAMRRVVETPGPVEWEERVIRGDGAIRQMSLRAQPLRGASGRVVKVIGVAQDVTERTEAETRLRDSERKFRLLFETSHDAVWIGSPDGRLLDMNPAGVQMLGFDSKDEIDGASLAETILPPGALAEALRQVAETGGLRDFECNARRRDGRPLRVVINASPVHDEQGRVSYLHGITRDVTEQRALERRLQQGQKLEAIGRLAAGVAHEINNPLTWMLTNAHDLGEDLQRSRPRLGEEKFARIATGIGELREGIERVAQIVRDLKAFGRADREDRTLVDPAAVVQRAADMAANEIRFRARLRREIDELPPVLVDEGRLLQVFVNLLVNAAEAIPEGEPAQNEIAIMGERENGFVRIDIRDTGRGIAPEHLPFVFDAFFTTKAPGEGSGLGLAISHQIVDDYGGSIDVESTPGEGAVFSVRLPVAEEKPEAKTVVTDALAASGARERSRILLVDDEPLIRSVASRLLRQVHEVLEARSGEEALEVLETDRRFGVILCDLMMPGIGGQGVYVALRESAPDLADRIVFMTGGAFTPMAAKFLESISNPCVEKPFEAAALFAAIDAVLAPPAAGTPRRF